MASAVRDLDKANPFWLVSNDDWLAVFRGEKAYTSSGSGSDMYAQ